MKRLLLAAAGLSMLAGPMAATAQPDQNWQGHNQNNQNNHESRQAPANRPQERQAPQTFRAPQQTGRYQAAPQNNGYRNQSAQPTWRGNGPNGSPERVQGNTNQYERYKGRGQAPMDRGGQGQYQYRNGGSGQVQTYRGGQYQNRNGGQYRSGAQNFRSWSGSTVRLRGDWWRGRPGFNGFEGRRDGYWFAPGWGYYRVDPRWWDFDWVVGATVPYQLQSYYVSDYWDYGLPPPPYGCEYIFLGDQIVLIDLGSGQILEIAGAY